MTPRERANRSLRITDERQLTHLFAETRANVETEIREAIDAATKPLREEIEALTLLLTDAQERLALHEQHDDDCPCSVDSVLLHAYSCLDCTCEIGQDFREMRHQLLKTISEAATAEARNKALVEALKIPHSSAPEDLDDEVCCRCGGPYNTRPGCDASPECDPCAQEVLALARAALAANEERGK